MLASPRSSGFTDSRSANCPGLALFPDLTGMLHHCTLFIQLTALLMASCTVLTAASAEEPAAIRHSLIVFGNRTAIIDESGQVCLGDEALTPDSSRFWPADQYQPGRGQPSYDKQFVRDYLESIHWNKLPPGPALPAEIAEKTAEKYREAYRILSGRTL